MKLFIALAALFALANAVPQDKNAFDCAICHFLGPSLEEFVDSEGELAEHWLEDECKKIPFIGHLCVDWLEKNVDPILKLLEADECQSACFACDIVLHCGAADCKPSCGRPSCTGCSKKHYI